MDCQINHERHPCALWQVNAHKHRGHSLTVLFKGPHSKQSNLGNNHILTERLNRFLPVEDHKKPLFSSFLLSSASYLSSLMHFLTHITLFTHSRLNFNTIAKHAFTCPHHSTSFLLHLRARCLTTSSTLCPWPGAWSSVPFDSSAPPLSAPGCCESCISPYPYKRTGTVQLHNETQM